MANRLVFTISLIAIVSSIGAANFIFAQTQSPCSSSASITDTSQAKPGVMLVISNSAQATFTITGPAIYHGNGFVWAQQNIPAGSYTIIWNSVSGCGTPSSETKTTDSRGSVAFAGNYVSTGGNALSLPTLLPTAYPATPLPTLKPQIKTTPYYTVPVPTVAPQTSSGKAKLVITSVPDGATVYVNNLLAGKAPLTYQVGEGSHQIRCVLGGYGDYYYGAAVSYYGARDGTTVEVVCKMSSSSGLNKKLQDVQKEDAYPQESALPVPQKQQGFLSHFWQSILSLFKRR